MQAGQPKALAVTGQAKERTRLAAEAGVWVQLGRPLCSQAELVILFYSPCGGGPQSSCKEASLGSMQATAAADAAIGAAAPAA